MHSANTKQVVLITGPIGAGKAALLRMLSQAGYAAIDIDASIRQVTSPGSTGAAQIVAQFGLGSLGVDGSIDWSTLLNAARGHGQVGRDLLGVIRPLLRAQLEEDIRRADGNLVFIAATDPDVFGLRDFADQCWTITADPGVRKAILVSERGWPPALAERMALTRTAGPLSRVDASLLNDGSLPRLRSQLIAALAALPAAAPGEAADGLPRETSAPAPSAVTPQRESRHTRFTRAIGKAQTRREGLEQPSTEAEAAPLPRFALLRSLGRRILTALLALLTLAFLTAWGLALAERGRQHLPAQPIQAAWSALQATFQYAVAHPQTYFWARADVPWLELVGRTLANSAGLLLLSMSVALAVGLPLGLAAGKASRKAASAMAVVLSVLAASTPSFLLAMMLWVANAWVHRTFSIKVLPTTGFGWDAHLIMPVLVLAARPLAQVAQITYVSVHEALQQDYIRTAYSKGLTWHAVRNAHLLRNVLIPILNTLASSLRFSLASLPVVEIFFRWPGVGLMILDVIGTGMDPLIMDLILALGLFFLVVNLAVEFSFPFVDPRLRAQAQSESRKDAQTVAGVLEEARDLVSSWLDDLRRAVVRSKDALPPLPNLARHDERPPQTSQDARRGWLLRSLARHPAFVVASLAMLALGALVFLGPNLSPASPYQLHGLMSIAGKYAAPPFRPSSIFPWGSDQLGRDMQALVLSGARWTLSLAFLGMLARMLLGATLGVVAGWQRGGWIDRLVTGATGVWAAFPATLFAMIVIQALGIQQGMWVFVVALSIVGWGEVAQYVRGQVLTLRPQPFIESARAVGARPDRILIRHVLPNLVNPLTVLAALEMGGILMLLAELGFLNIFMGGGFQTMIGETGNMQPIVAFYSDVPEWSALIANVREYWRSYPWMALYPGLAFFLSILAFNVFGETLRNFLESSAVGLSRLFNRRGLMAAAAVLVGLVFVLRSATPLQTYRAEAVKFDEQRLLEDIRVLSAPEMQGRETGLPGADLAAIYIARRMEEIGIAPAGGHQSYLQRLLQPRMHLWEAPTLALIDDGGNSQRQFAYKQDFTEYAQLTESTGSAQGKIMGVAYGPVRDPASGNGQFGLANSAAVDHVIIVRLADLPKVLAGSVKGILAVADDPSQLQRRDVYPYAPPRGGDGRPYFLVSSKTADALLATAGSSLAELDAARASLEPGLIKLTPEGTSVDMELPSHRAENYQDEAYQNVIGVIPGQGHFVGTEEQVIIVSAYYDGVGTDPLGTIYPGANDNASGVAMMLELARLLKASPYQPDKTVLFVAWAGGERQQGLNVVDILNARPGASDFTVESVLELSGVGHGSGNGVAIGDESSYRLVKLFQGAAGEIGTSTTTRGRGPHYGLPAPTILGGREAMTLSLSWDGSDDTAHTPEDTVATIDPMKLRRLGRPAYLTLLVLCRETDF